MWAAYLPWSVWTTYELWIRPWYLGREQLSRSFGVVGRPTKWFPRPFKTVAHAITNQTRQQAQCGCGFFRLDRIAPVTTVIRGWRTCSEPKFITSQGLFQSSRFAAQVTMCGWQPKHKYRGQARMVVARLDSGVRWSSFRQKNPDSSIETRPRRARGRSFSIR